MTQVTDEDRRADQSKRWDAALEAALNARDSAMADAAYRKGFNAGLERAARIAGGYDQYGEPTEQRNAAAAIATAIRAAKEPSNG